MRDIAPIGIFIIGCALISPSTMAFNLGSRRFFSKIRYAAGHRLSMTTTELPSLQQVEKDPFMKQISHASNIISQMTISKNDDDPPLLLCQLLEAQFSHSDGIRGFFVTYLTGESSSSDDDDDDDGTTLADNPEVSLILRDAMAKADPTDLVPLACMNVIMPTAMISMHSDPLQSERSAITATRAKIILKALKDNDDVRKNCVAINAVATGATTTTDADDDDGDDELVQYWTKFFVNYGYKDEEKRNIANAVADFI